jgi:hypothetical protein
MIRGYEEYVDPLSEFSNMLKLSIPAATSINQRSCNYQISKAQDAAFGWSLLSSRNYVDLDSPMAKNYINDAIKDLIAHEVGHTIGLRHNFRASTIHTLDQLKDKELTIQEGITGSVMDYNPVNLAPKGEIQGQYFHTAVGPYDNWAIEYAYIPSDAGNPEDEIEKLEKIAARVSEPKLAYGTDEDAVGFAARGIDPETNLYDLGADPITYYKGRMDLVNELMKTMEEKFEVKGMRYQKMRLVFGAITRQYFFASSNVPKYIGGIYHRRDHMGDEGNRTPFEPVDSEKQREAMRFLKEYLFGPNAFQIPHSLMKKMAPERFEDFDWSFYYTPRIDFPMHDIIIGFQKIALNRLYHPITMNRMVDLTLYFNESDSRYTLTAMYKDLRNSIWAEVENEMNINSIRRNLQRAHLDILIRLVVKPTGAPYFTPSSGQKPAGTTMPPADAITLARADLQILQGSIKKALSGMDYISKAHLEESLARINAALNAQVNIEM